MLPDTDRRLINEGDGVDLPTNERRWACQDMTCR
jgi:hypothetical protein